VNFISILIIAIGLGMDAFSVAVGVGANSRALSLMPALRLSFHFGLFQFLMPIAGWFAGSTVANIIAAYDHWIAFGLLAVVGGKMIVESFSQEEKVFTTDPTRGITLIMLSVATSIDALAVGLGFAFLKIPILIPSIIIGIVAFCMTAMGMFFGDKLGKVFGRRVGIVGGVILIVIGVKIVIEHMM
jgi:putative Mn2+ efflux pump MntP